MPLSMSEDILLLMLDDETGRPLGLPAPAVELAVAGAVLMDLALLGHIRLQHQAVLATDTRPLVDPVLDDAQRRIGQEPHPQDAAVWLNRFSLLAIGWRDQLLDKLVARGILYRVEERFLWVFPDRRYPVIEATELREVRARLRAVMLEGEAPSSQDAMLVGLVQAVGLLPFLLSETEMAEAAPRIAKITGLEELAQAVSDVAQNVYASMIGYGIMP